ncbi:saccharopine dehydrogenase family protein [Mycolicibacterium palauense]|uniref:saccharopine dehydrogenase family protein n=1 Tax=Mycolicibacterium palauense TaxID=2034511 RepID=UPI000BFEAAA2|nr:saccharopine dehydrogenase NADP-binding domain-containing protein [Mycolicibacterium palauense]
MVATEREFDIVLYGATGFVGKLTAQYLAGAAADRRIALAGRSPERVGQVRSELGAVARDWPIITADAGSPSTLNDLAARTRVVITTVGPYSKYGLPLVAACAAAGTDYADLTGEPNFIRDSIDLHHKQAVDTGARIVHACGFDSIPSDLTVFELYRRAAADGAGELLDTNLVVRSFAGGVSGGTVASMLELMRESSLDPDMRAQLNDPYTLSPDSGAEPQLGRQPDVRWHRGSEIAPELRGYWTGAFAMALPNSRIVRRSNALLDFAYGRRFAYGEQMSLGKSPLAPLAAAAITGANAFALGPATRLFHLAPRGLVDRIAPKPGTGPDEHRRETGHYTVETYTTTASGQRYRATMSQQADPGYKATALMLGESGLALATDRDELSDLRGVLTPVAAMGDVLSNRLRAAGVRLETERLQ